MKTQEPGINIRHFFARFFFVICIGKAVTKCQTEYQNILRNFPPSITRYVPRCSADGSYEEIQCSGAICYCVTPQGQQISGTRTFSYIRRPNCTQSGEVSFCLSGTWKDKKKERKRKEKKRKSTAEIVMLLIVILIII